MPIEGSWFDTAYSLFYDGGFMSKPKPERRHIQYKAEVCCPKNDKIKVTITEQTHRSWDFTPSDDRFNHLGFSLVSMDCPAYCSEERPATAYLRGRRKEYDTEPLFIPIEVYPAFKQAVLAYNAAFSGDKEEAKIPKKQKEVQARVPKRKPNGKLKREPKAESRTESWQDTYGKERWFR